MLIFDETGRSWGLGKKIASGGEGTVHRLLDSADYCAKLYHALPIPPLKQAKLAALRCLPASARQNAAIPVSLAFAKPGGQSAHSVILPLVPGHDIYELYNPQGRSQHFRGSTYEFLVAAAANLAAAFHNLHAHGIVIGDINEQNIKVRTDATVRLIDCDSFQFRHDGRLFTSDVGTPLWTPPELQGASVQGLARTTNHDAFGLAQLIFLLLFAGRYPYAGRPLTASPLSPEEAVRQYAFAYAPTHEKQLLAPPPGAPPFNALPGHMRTLFLRAFSKGSAAPGHRPSAAEWMEALQQLSDNLTACPTASRHVFWKGAAECPWCAVKRTVKADLFPGPPVRAEDEPAASHAHVDLAKRLLALTFHPLELVEPSVIAVKEFLAGRPRPLTQRPLLAAALQFLGLSPKTAPDARTLALDLERLEQRLLELRALSDALTLQFRTSCDAALQEATALAAKLKDTQALRLSALERLRERHLSLAMEKHLEGFLLRRTKIPGIGGSRLAALLSAGITTAADVREEDLGNIPWIGPHCVAKLVAWRRECEAGFKFIASGSVPDLLRVQLNALVTDETEELAITGSRLEEAHQETLAAYTKEFGRLQQEFEVLWKQRAAVKDDLKTLGAP